MDHRGVSPLLADYRDGRLAPETEAAVDRHVKDCADCAAWLETLGLLARAGRRDESSPGHPSSDRIATFAVQPEAMDRADLALVAEHARGCSSCRQELETTRRAVGEARGAARSGAWWSPSHPTFRVAMAAGLLIGLLAYPAYRGVRFITVGASEWAGPVGYLMLSGETRSDEMVETLVIRPGQPSVLLAVAVTAPTEAAPGELFDVEILEESGKTVWQTALTTAALEAEVAEFEVLFLQVPVLRLPPGEYTLQVSATKTDETIFLSRFRLRAGDRSPPG